MKVSAVEPSFPSVTLGESMERTGRESSSRMVPVPVPITIAAPEAFERFTTTVSSDSTAVSPVTETVTVRLVSPGAKASDPAVSAV